MLPWSLSATVLFLVKKQRKSACSFYFVSVTVFLTQVYAVDGVYFVQFRFQGQLLIKVGGLSLVRPGRRLSSACLMQTHSGEWSFFSDSVPFAGISSNFSICAAEVSTTGISSDDYRLWPGRGLLLCISVVPLAWDVVFPWSTFWLPWGRQKTLPKGVDLREGESSHTPWAHQRVAFLSVSVPLIV